MESREQAPGLARVLPLGPSCSILLVLFIALRVALCFLPCDQWGPSGYLCASAYLALPLGEPHTCVANSAIPEGARLSNRLDYLSFRQERFTLDELGLRNDPRHPVEHPQALLFGSSFSLGLALNDDETFAARLNQQLGPLVYNAASTFSPGLYADPLTELARLKGMRRGWIVVEVVNRDSYSYDQLPPRVLPPGVYGEVYAGALNRYRQLRDGTFRALLPATRIKRSLKLANPLTRLSTLVNMRIHNGVILPNPFFHNYGEERLVSGHRMLVYATDKRFTLHPDKPEKTWHALVRLRDELKRQGYDLAVLMLPNAYSVYYTQLADRPAGDAGADYMDGLSGRLSASGIANLNLLPILRTAAESEMSAGRLIYYSDDAHWNARGCEIAARAAAPWLQSLLKGEAAAKP